MHLIRRNDTADYLTLYGFKPNREIALQFRTPEDAEAYARTIPSLYGAYIVEPHKDLEVRTDPGVVSDYDPFRPPANV